VTKVLECTKISDILSIDFPERFKQFKTKQGDQFDRFLHHMSLTKRMTIFDLASSLPTKQVGSKDDRNIIPYFNLGYCECF
jgi:hypothetical protein